MAVSHLTEDQIADVLCGTDTPEVSFHLERCAACRGQIDAFQGATALLRSASAEWSERRSAAMRVPVASDGGWSSWQPAATWATAAFVLAAVLTPFAMHYQQNTREVAMNTPQPTLIHRPAAIDIERDNAMLAQIDSTLSQRAPSPQKIYGLSVDGDGHGDTHRGVGN